MTEEVYLGIDTSCYTTSLFFMNRQGQKVAEARRILKVKPGGCGLQQSEMLYQHTRNLPELMEEAVQGHAFSLLGIGVSAKPLCPPFWQGRALPVPWQRYTAFPCGRSATRKTI